MLKKLIQGIAVGLCGAAVAWGLWMLGALAWIENPSWDWRVGVFARPSAATDSIRIVLRDQNSLDWAEENQSDWRWPWPREVFSAVIDFCRRSGAKAVIFDVLFTEPSKDGPADDEALGASIARSGRFVGAVHLGQRQGRATAWPDDLNARSFPVASLDEYAARHASSPVMAARAAFPTPEIATNCAVLGDVSGLVDRDKVIRRVLPFRVFDERFVPSLGLAGYLASVESPLAIEDTVLYVGNTTVPLDDKGRAILRYRGRHAYTVVSAQSVIQSEIRLRDGEGGPPPLGTNDFRGKYVLLGFAEPGSMDVRATPLTPICPGTLIHATFLDNLLANDLIRDTPTWLAVLLTLLFASAGGAAGRSCGKGWHAAVAFAIFLPLSLAPGFAGYPLGYWTPVAPLVIGSSLGLLGAFILNYAMEGRQKRFIKNAFQQYLSPHFIEKLVENPERLKLGGETRELSIYFSDVQGFTTISESLTPENLTALLNEYLTAMTDIVMEEGGTVDKYEGDAVIAFWNAPLDLPNHAVCAVRSALRCQAALVQLRPVLKEKYGKDVYCRIGLNTGKVVIGNMGSHQRFNYTFLGDAGNLAARLEGANKQFGTYMMISEFTRDKIGKEFATRELSRLRVKGKIKPVGVFEPMYKEDYARRRDVLDAFAAALKAYYDGRFQEALDGFAAIADRDAPAASYVKRCRELVAHPPPEWDGVWELTEK